MDPAASSIRVAIRIRPFSSKEQSFLSDPTPAFTPFHAASSSTAAPITSTAVVPSVPSHAMTRGGALRRILKVLDERVLVFDPPDTNPLSQFNKQVLGESSARGKKVKDMRFCFDRVFDENAGQDEVYDGSAADLVKGVMSGFNGSVFAYGATGCGKTHTISGTPQQPGLVFLIMRDLFGQIASNTDVQTELSISYLEVYNETIRDLLSPSNALQLREIDGNKMTVPGLSEHVPTSPEEVISMIHRGNSARTVSPTEANATSSRSHAVLFINVKTRQHGGTSDEFNLATLNVIDLAGSERASVTKNRGERLVEGANINRSLLALGNCINALCDPRKRNHVPYRDSKLTRLLKHSLGGNCRTVMIVCLSPSSAHYDETHNTLQYANRAKEIKTKVLRNTISVDRHVSQYVRVILELRQEVAALKAAERSSEDAGKEKERKSRKDGFKSLEREWEKVVGFAEERVVDLKQRAFRAGAAKECATSLQFCLSALRSVGTREDDAEWNRMMDETLNRLHNTRYDMEPFLQAKQVFWETVKFHSNKMVNEEVIEKWKERETRIKLEVESEEARGRAEGALESQKLLLNVIQTAHTLDSETAQNVITQLVQALNSTSPSTSPNGVSTSPPTTYSISTAPTMSSLGVKRVTRDVEMDVDPPPRPGKAARTSLAQASPPPLRRSTLTRSKLQHKPSRLSTSTGPGILRSSPKKVLEKKAVGWRDENGEDLESVHANSSHSFSSEGNITKASDAESSGSSFRVPSGEFSFTAPTSTEVIAASRPTRATRLSNLGNGPRRAVPATKGTMLSSLGEEDESTASIDSSSTTRPAPRKRFSLLKPSGLDRPPLRASMSMANTSMAGTFNGLVAPISLHASMASLNTSTMSNAPNENKNTPRKKRLPRASSIGPIRSVKKTRRSSVLMPPPPRRILGKKDQDDSLVTDAAKQMMSPKNPRKASRPSGIGSAARARVLRSKRESVVPPWR